MKLFSKIFKTIGIMFTLILFVTLYGCEMTQPSVNQLETPSFITTTSDKEVTVFVQTTLHSDGYALYVYQNNGLKNKFNINANQAISGYKIYLNYGEYEIAVQAIDSTGTYTASNISKKKGIVLTEKVNPHEHNFIEGKCECGEIDPNYNPIKSYKINYVLNGGTLANDAPLSYIEGETTFLKNPIKDNAVFGGWYLKSDFSGDKLELISNKTTGDITLYAKWESNDVEYTGYYKNANDLIGTALKKALRTIISTGVKPTSYDDLKTKLPYTDASLEDSSKMKLLYSNHLVVGKVDGWVSWNREHVWPKSQGWFDTSGAGSDIHHIRPENPSVNSTRGNKPFGEITNGTAVKCCGEIVAYSTSSYFEPFDEFKGDCARIIFYMLVRYSESDSYSITKVAQSMDMLLKWHETDPVDAFELQRNERCYTVQNNRNPFIDHPEFADMIWG